jgi:hypothetical protein
MLSILIFTKNEQLHINRCIESAKRISSSIYVVDSMSTDQTKDICLSHNVFFFEGEYNCFADKFNWALLNIDFSYQWVLRLDSDEFLTENFIYQIKSFLSSLENDISGIYLNRQLSFLQTPLKFGGMNRNYSIRIWKKGSVYCENKKLDEHLVLKYGSTVKTTLTIVDMPLISLSEWIDKHNRYSTLEALSYYVEKNSVVSIKYILSKSPVKRKKYLKYIFYKSMPIFFRPLIIFLYRYIFLLGFLDGYKGFLFHFYQFFYYRLLVDTKIYELDNNRDNEI